MASALKYTSQFIQAHPFPEVVQRRTSLVAGSEEDIAHGGPASAVPVSVTSQTVVPPTSNDPVLFSWIKDDTDTTNGKVRLKWDTIAGGDLSGAEVEVHIVFGQVKDAGNAAV